MTNRTVIKFSSTNCVACYRMAEYDRQIVEEMGLQFIDVKMQDTATYRQYRHILLTQYPKKAGMAFPTYLICELSEGEFKILGEVRGENQSGDFRRQLQQSLTF